MLLQLQKASASDISHQGPYPSIWRLRASACHLVAKPAISEAHKKLTTMHLERGWEKRKKTEYSHARWVEEFSPLQPLSGATSTNQKLNKVNKVKNAVKRDRLRDHLTTTECHTSTSRNNSKRLQPEVHVFPERGCFSLEAPQGLKPRSRSCNPSVEKGDTQENSLSDVLLCYLRKLLFVDNDQNDQNT